MNEGTVDSGIEFDISSLLSVSDVVELEVEAETTTNVQASSAPEYHELKSRVVVGRWVDSFAVPLCSMCIAINAPFSASFPLCPVPIARHMTVMWQS